jgi:hypothetical protein
MNTRFNRSWVKTFTGPHYTLLTSLTLLAVLLLSACAPAAPAATPSPSPTAVPPTPAAPPTATNVPTQTALPSPTITLTPTLVPTPTQTATPLPALLSDGFDAWCLPGDSHNRGLVTSKMPADAGHFKQVKDAIQLTVPMGSCTFVYTFNQPLPPTAEFQIYDVLDHLAYKMPLTSPEGQPNVGVVTLDNQLMVNPPYWAITFRMAVYTPESGQLWSSRVNFARPPAAACFDPASGILPDPVTGVCPAADPRELELCRKPGSTSCYFRGKH